MKISREVLLRIIGGLLRPIVRLCLRHSLKLQDISECLRQAALSVASEQLERDGEAITGSRLSIISGLHRREIARLQSHTGKPSQEVDLLAKVMGMWQTNEDYLTAHGLPRLLSHGFVESQFSSLVRSVSKDLNPATILFELERTGSLERTTRGVRLLKQSYVPAKDAEAGFSIATRDVDSLLAAVEENLTGNLAVPNLHARTYFDRIRTTNLTALRAELVRAGHKFHAEVRALLAEHDQDVNPDPTYQGTFAEVAVGAVSHVVTPEAKEKNDEVV
jgi:hypothetical protein